MLVPLYSAILLKIIVELLNLDGSQLIQFDVAQLGDDVVVDVIQVIIFGFFSEPRFGIDFIPQLDPAPDRVSVRPGDIQLLAVRDCFL